MFRRTLASCAALLVAFTATAPAYADDPDPNAAIKAQTEKLKAEKDLVDAQTDLVKAKVSALNLPTAEGKVTLADSAGSMEAWILSAQAIGQAAKHIAEDKAIGSNKVIVLGPSDTLNLALPFALSVEMKGLGEAADNASSNVKQCATSRPAAERVAPAALAVAGAVISLLKVDTEVRGLSADVNDRALVNALAARLKSQAILPSEAAGPVPITNLSFNRDDPVIDGTLNKQWSEVSDKRHALAQCREILGGLAKPSDLDKAHAAAIDAVISEIDDFASRAFEGTKDSPPLFVQASQQAWIVKQKPLILRVSIEHAGGSLIQRTNLWTAFGALGVTMTGGLVASYRVVEPTTGEVKSADLLFCPTGLTDMKSAQAGTVKAGVCKTANP